MNIKMNKNNIILLCTIIFAFILVLLKIRNVNKKEAFEESSDYTFRKHHLKGTQGTTGNRGPRGSRGDKGQPGPPCNNIISQLENRGYLNLGGTKKINSANNTQLELNGDILEKNKPFYKLKISNYNDSYPLLIGNNEEDSNLYLKKYKDTNGFNNFKMSIKGNLKITGNLELSNNNNMDRFDGVNNIFYNLAPVGLIAAFYNNKEETIPILWTICNGKIKENGFQTPNLIGKFIMGGNEVGSHNTNDSAFDEKNKLKNGKIKLSLDHMPKHEHQIKPNGTHSHRIELKEAGKHRHTIDVNGGDGSANSTGNNFVLKKSGGTQTKVHSSSVGNHSHRVLSETETGIHNHNISYVGEGKEIDIMPPYYSLIYIIKYK